MFTSTHDPALESQRDIPELSNTDNGPNAVSNNNPPQSGGNAASTTSQLNGGKPDSSSPHGGSNVNEDVNSNQPPVTSKQIEELMTYLTNNNEHHYQHETLHPVTDDGSLNQTRSSTASSSSPSNGRTLVDLLILSVHGFMEMFYPSTGAEELTPEEKKLLLISDEELDDLALFQGVVETYLALHVGKVARQKLEKMEDLLKHENHIEWERRCRQLMTQGALQTDMMRGLDGWRGKLRGVLGGWSRKNCSENAYLLDDQMTAHRIPMINQTDGVRGKLGVMSGKHAWDLKVNGPTGTHFSVGVSTDKGPLISTKGYVSLIGGDEKGQSWGWDLVWGNLSHKGRTIGVYPRFIVYQYTVSIQHT